MSHFPIYPHFLQSTLLHAQSRLVANAREFNDFQLNWHRVPLPLFFQLGAAVIAFLCLFRDASNFATAQHCPVFGSHFNPPVNRSPQETIFFLVEHRVKVIAVLLKEAGPILHFFFLLVDIIEVLDLVCVLEGFSVGGELCLG